MRPRSSAISATSISTSTSAVDLFCPRVLTANPPMKAWAMFCSRRMLDNCLCCLHLGLWWSHGCGCHGNCGWNHVAVVGGCCGCRGCWTLPTAHRPSMCSAHTASTIVIKMLNKIDNDLRLHFRIFLTRQIVIMFLSGSHLN